ncbi:MAG: 3-hydroxyanthranilate 3,4-dioxygenase [Ramlibacter sp.]
MQLPVFATLQGRMPQVDLAEIMEYLRGTNERRTYPLWQEDDCLAFIARGREYRSEFHLNPSFEMQYSLKGPLNLHWRTPEGKEQVSVVPEGHCLYQAPMVPHSPRFGPDVFQLVIERKRRPGEIDKFHWYCPMCDHFLHEETFVVADYGADPVSRAYDNFFSSMEFRTCKQCGTVMPDR